MSKADILRIPDYLGHILEAIVRIHLYIEDMSEVAFLEDRKTQDAVIRNFEIIGEAAHNIERYHAQFAVDHSDVPWSVVYTMRNRVSHGYFQVDLEIVWKTIHTDLPELHAKIRKLLEQISQVS
ncbi:MAG: DUF86 domain-containing protein [Gallionella sp.]|jgi:uncharacterized protein with HEPN domain